MKNYDAFDLKTGQYIKELRQNKNISQKELGRIIKVRSSTIEKWENGDVKNLKRSDIQKLADYFKVSPVTFIGIQNPNNFSKKY